MKITIVFENADEVIGNLGDIGKKAAENLEKQAAKLSDAGQEHWRQVTPRRTGKLQGSERGMPDGLVIEFTSSIFYYRFVDEGHMTPREFHGRPARHISHVPAKEMTGKLVEFLVKNIFEYLSKFLEF